MVSAGEGLADRTCPWQVVGHPIANSLHEGFWHKPIGLYVSGHPYSNAGLKDFAKMFFGVFFTFSLPTESGDEIGRNILPTQVKHNCGILKNTYIK